MGSMKLRALGWIALLTVLFYSDKASAANIYAELLGGQPTLLTASDAQNAAEIGQYEYIYDVYMDNESQFDEFQIEGFDASQIINQHPFSHSSVTGVLTQKWDAYAQSASTNSWDRSAYGSYNDSGSWTIPAGYTDLGEGIINKWHDIGDYQGTSSWAGVNPKFIGPGAITPDSFGDVDRALRFVNKVTTGTHYTGLVSTFRVVHPAAPGTITFSAYSFNSGGTLYTNTLLGPGALTGSTVPEPGTLGLLGFAALACAAVVRRRSRRG